jgi:hypothetical protein
MRLIFTIILAGIFTTAIAQDKKPAPLSRLLISGSLGITPIPNNPLTILPGIEFYITERVSLFNEISLQTEKNKDFDSSSQNKKYFRYKAELRYYLTGDERNIKPYVAAQFTTARRSFDRNRQSSYFIPGSDDSVFQYNRANINSPVQTATVQVGLAMQVFRRCYFDVAGGFGARFTNTAYTNVVGLQKVSESEFFGKELAAAYRFPGRQTRIQINLNFRFSYRFP